jgi:hypothetical protein
MGRSPAEDVYGRPLASNYLNGTRKINFVRWQPDKAVAARGSSTSWVFGRASLGGIHGMKLLGDQLLSESDDHALRIVPPLRTTEGRHSVTLRWPAPRVGG